MVNVDLIQEISQEHWRYYKWCKQQVRKATTLHPKIQEQFLAKTFPQPTYSEEINNMVF